MKNYRMVPSIVLSVSTTILLFNIAFIIFNFLKAKEIDYILQIVIFIIVSILQICVINKYGKRFIEVATKFAIDSFPGKQMSIETELYSNVINEQDKISKIELLQQEIETLKNIDNAMVYLIKIPLVIMVLILPFAIVFIIGNIVGSKLIENSLFNNVIIFGIISQLMITGLTLYVSIVTTKIIKKPNNT